MTKRTLYIVMALLALLMVATPLQAQFEVDRRQRPQLENNGRFFLGPMERATMASGIQRLLNGLYPEDQLTLASLRLFLIRQPSASPVLSFVTVPHNPETMDEIQNVNLYLSDAVLEIIERAYSGSQQQLAFLIARAWSMVRLLVGQPNIYNPARLELAAEQEALLRWRMNGYIDAQIIEMLRSHGRGRALLYSLRGLPQLSGADQLSFQGHPTHLQRLIGTQVIAETGPPAGAADLYNSQHVHLWRIRDLDQRTQSGTLSRTQTNLDKYLRDYRNKYSTELLDLAPHRYETLPIYDQRIKAVQMLLVYHAMLNELHHRDFLQESSREHLNQLTQLLTALLLREEFRICVELLEVRALLFSGRAPLFQNRTSNRPASRMQQKLTAMEPGRRQRVQRRILQHALRSQVMLVDDTHRLPSNTQLIEALSNVADTFAETPDGVFFEAVRNYLRGRSTIPVRSPSLIK